MTRFDCYKVGDILSKNYTYELFKIVNFNKLIGDKLYYRSDKFINSYVKFGKNESNRSKLRKMIKISDCYHFIEWLPDDNTIRKIKLMILNYE